MVHFFLGIFFIQNNSNNSNDFVSLRVSNLADIFEDDEYEKVDVEQPTLKFKPPIRNQSQKTTEKSTWDVVIAKIVGAYKLYVYKEI